MKIIDYLSDKMYFTSKKRDVIVDNISNINTPKYLTKEITDYNTQHIKNNSILNNCYNMYISNPKHMTNDITHHNDKYKVYVNRSKKNMKLDGNNVNLEQESLKYTKNNIQYEESLLLYKKWIAIMSNMFNTISR